MYNRKANLIKNYMAALQSVRGFRDIYGQSYDLMALFLRTAQDILGQFGYHGIELPIVEYTPVFQRSLGDTSDIVHKEMYTFLDRNQESLTLRPEGTAGLVRALISNKMTQDLPQKFFYHGPMFRYERPQKGRYRQFYQLGVECLGIDHPYIDYEVIQLAVNIFDALGITGYTLHLNTLGDQESRAKFNDALTSFLTNHKNDLSEDSQLRLTTNPLRILDSKDQKDQKIIAHGPKLRDYLSQDSKIFFDRVCAYLSHAGVAFKLDDCLVRGLDYYCHTSFEFKHEGLGAQSAFAGGGRYDGLVELMGGPAIGGIGWGMGIDRIVLLLEQKIYQSLSPIIVIPFEDAQLQYALDITNQLRKDGKSCELSFKGKLSKDLKYAQKLNAQYVLLIGSDEVAQNTVTIKYMDGVTANKTVKKEEVVF